MTEMAGHRRDQPHRPPRPARSRPTTDPARRAKPAVVAKPSATRRFHRFMGGLVGFTAVLLVVAAVKGMPSESTVEEPEPTTVPATSTTTTIPLRPASQADPLRILVAGDSLVGWIPAALEAEFAGRPVEVIDEWKGSSGLARPDFFDWPAQMADMVEIHDPDVIVVGFGGNDTQSLVTDGEVIQRGDPKWEVEYARRVGQVLDAAHRPGRTLWWIGLPLSQRDNVEALRPAITAAITGELAARPWTRYVDASAALAPDGVYRVTVSGPDGEEVRIRADDGIHLSPEGGRMIVEEFLSDLESERAIPAAAEPPSTTTSLPVD